MISANERYNEWNNKNGIIIRKQFVFKNNAQINTIIFEFL